MGRVVKDSAISPAIVTSPANATSVLPFWPVRTKKFKSFEAARLGDFNRNLVLEEGTSVAGYYCSLERFDKFGTV